MSAAARKPRPDSRLKTLPLERQAAIAEHLRTHTLAETRGWLREGGLQTSTAALSEFLSYYILARRLDQNRSIVETLLERMRRQDPDIAPEKLFTLGQAFFSALALERQDALGWARTQQVGIAKRSADLEARRIELLERKAALADAAQGVTASNLTPEQKQARMREIFSLV